MTSSRLSVRLSILGAAAVGLLAVAAGLGTGHLVGGLVSPTASPFLAVGNTAIDLTPTWLKDFAVRNFGVYDKLVLLLGMAVVIGLFGVAAGLLSRRSRIPGLVLILMLGGVATTAVLTRPVTGALDVLAPLSALIISLAVFVLLHGWAQEGRDRSVDAAAAQTSRRRLLAGSAAVAAGAGIAAAGGQLLAGRGGVESSRAALGRIVPA
ncbi:MAG: molybdopterin-dependent oxidoreductase, partial [Pseudonocardiaceae bacterium]